METNNILITNDDGIKADGLIRLAQTAKEFGNVWVVAPSIESSASSHSITLRHSMEIHPYDFPIEGVKAYSLTGTPADCIRVGIRYVMKDKPDIVMSGINSGYNMATDIQYSATAGAAFEAVFQGIKAIAFSEHFFGEHEVTERYLRELMAELIKEPFVPGQIINVNFPGCTLEECKGVLRDRKVSQLVYYEDQYDELKKFDDGGAEIMVRGVHEPATEEGTDYAAVLGNYVSVGRVNNIG